MSLQIKETFLNADKGYSYGSGEWYEPYHDESRKALFRSLQREYGRCDSKMYIDKADGSVESVGWVFTKRVQYDDCDETYIREVWVSVRDWPGPLREFLRMRDILRRRYPDRDHHYRNSYALGWVAQETIDPSERTDILAMKRKLAY